MASTTRKKSTQNNKRTTKSRSASGKRKTASSRTSRQDAAMLAQEEKRAMEVRRDIRLLVLFAALAFVMIAELGYGGVVGKAVSSVMFGLFGTTAYVMPLFVFVMVIFIISNLGKRTLPVRAASLVVLMIAIGAGFELWGGEAAKAAGFDPAAIYQRCAAAKEGGGLIGGSLAYGLFSLFRNV
ncbi:MAG: hypothetical protein IJ100_11305, partial [Lachnospiraceae bacterium]|nr:hypothetical protein [Lachnospiraceae bacterium]